MSLLRQIENWSETHNPKWLAFFRVALGVSLFMRGASFLTNTDQFHQLILNSSLHTNAVGLAEVIPWIHLAGGFLIIIGLLTRVSCFLQIPILLGAIIFINGRKDFFSLETTLGFSIILLLLLIVFFIEGSGPLSISSYLKNG